MPTQIELSNLWLLCKDFVETNNVRCAETIYQVDSVMQNLAEFVESICNLVGYKKSDDDMTLPAEPEPMTKFHDDSTELQDAMRLIESSLTTISAVQETLRSGSESTLLVIVATRLKKALDAIQQHLKGG